jgi:hypothetical protein
MPSKTCWTSVCLNYDRAKISEIYAEKSLGLIESYFTYTSHNPEYSVLGTKQHKTYIGKSFSFVHLMNLLIHGYGQGIIHYF